MESSLTPKLIRDRQLQLDQLRPQLSAAFATAIAAKLQIEARDVSEMLAADTAVKTALAQYSFVLDQRYFEQKFLT